MNDLEIDVDLRQPADRVTDLSRGIAVDPHHKARLREELLQRHQELIAESTQRATFTLWPRFSGLKRLTLVAPPALAAAMAATVLLWILPVFSGHQAPQAAEAARLTQALARSAPTVTGWQWTVRETRGNRMITLRQGALFQSYQQMRVKYDRLYFWDGHRWDLAPTAPLAQSRVNGNDWEWAFTFLPENLATKDVQLLPEKQIDGRLSVGLQYALPTTGDLRIMATAWVDRESGLVGRLERDVVAGDQLVEHDVADFTYKTSR